MSEQFQFGQHPNADQLSAFVEHALPLHEQQPMLAHLACCAECRSIVYLGQEFDIEDSAAQVAAESVTRPRPWFLGWALAWPAAAAFACLLFATVLLHNLSASKGNRGTTSRASISTNPEAIPVAPQTPQVSLPQKSASLPVHTKPSVGQHPSVIPSVGVAAVVPSVATEPNHAASPVMQGEGVQPLPLNGRNFAKLMPLQSSEQGVGSGTGVAAGIGAGVSRSTAAKSGGKVENALAVPQPRMDAGTVFVQQLSTAPAPAPQSFSSGTIQNSLSLPSHLAAVSMISKASQVLAIDSAGTLFLSQDAGRHWMAVRQRWPGHAVKVSFTSSIRGNQGAAHRADTSTLRASGAVLGGVVGGIVAQPDTQADLLLTGVVRDASGAVIPNATVVVTNSKTLQSRTVKSDAAGRYEIQQLEPGSYVAEVRSLGFRTGVLDGVVIAASHPARVDFTLDIGAATQTVEVTAEAPVLQTESPDSVATIEGKNSSDAKLPVYELTTDTGAVWTSTDGRKWKPE